MENQTYEERQEDEVEFLQCVFMNDFEDLRNLDPWKVKYIGFHLTRLVSDRPSMIIAYCFFISYNAFSDQKTS